MFDNEIDWVMRIKVHLRNREPRGSLRDALVDDAIHTRPSTSNELLQVSNSGKVFKVRRVSLGVVTR
jgi:hypothetical protein